MIDYVKGEIAELSPTEAVVDCGGVGYLVNISLNTYMAIQGKSECKLFVCEIIREDAHNLFGFSSKEERNLFLLLISVSGIGGNTARMILSSFSPAELCNVIAQENANVLKAVKGIGLKTAQRVIVDLKDKIPNLSVAAGQDKAVSRWTEVEDEALSALVMLGFAAQPSRKAVEAISAENPGLPVEKMIKLALKRL